VPEAAKIVLEPIFEADFLPCSFGFRPKRSATDAMERIRVGFIEGKQFVFEADIRNFFNKLDHSWLKRFLEHRIADKRVLHLIQKWLAAGVIENGDWKETLEGAPQGGLCGSSDLSGVS